LKIKSTANKAHFIQAKILQNCTSTMP